MIYRKSHDRNYTVVSNSILHDTRLSVKARCILAIMLTYPDDWSFNYSHLKKVTKLSRDSLIAGVNELKKYGYLRIEKSNSGGRINYEWFVYESPCMEIPYTENQYTENQYTENQYTENQTLLNTNIPSTEELNTE